MATETFRERYRYKVAPFLHDAMQHKSLPTLVYDICRHKALYATDPADYLRYRFYDEAKTTEEKKRYLSKRGGCYFPWDRNPVSLFMLFDDKLLFKSILGGQGVPQARLLTTIGPGHRVRTADDLRQALASIQQDVVIKPIRGSNGRGVRVLERADGGFSEGGRPLDISSLWQELASGQYAGFIVEERLRNRQDLADFNASCLNTLRIVTIRTDDTQWHVSLVALRIGNGEKHVDNLSAGGTVVKFDASGVATAAYDWTERRDVERHAGSGLPLIGFRLEGNAEIRHFALDAAQHFPQMAAIGWDIALTDEGPKVVEANPFFGCWAFQAGSLGPLLTPEIAGGLKPRSALAKWDRRFVSPRLRRGRIRA